jgi:methyl-accepting chemotaxis protein
MGGWQILSTAILSTLALGFAGCGANNTDQMSLDDYVKKSCAITVDFNDRLGRLTHDFATNAKNQNALAGTVQDMADLYDELIIKSDELGDSPNGEGTGDDAEVEQAVKSLATELRAVSTDIRDAKSNGEVKAAISRMNDAIVKSTATAADWQKKHPTPELDRLKKAIPGCSDTPG